MVASRLSAAEIDAIEAKYPEVVRPNRRRQLMVGGVFAVLAVYFVYFFIAFDVVGRLAKARIDRAQLLALDLYSWKTHVAVDMRDPSDIEALQENSRFNRYDPLPDWIEGEGGSYVIDLGDDGRMLFEPGLLTVEAADGRRAVVQTGDHERADPRVLHANTPYTDIVRTEVPMLDDDGTQVIGRDGNPRTRTAFEYYRVDGVDRTGLDHRPVGVWIEQAENKVEIRLGLYARATVKSAKLEVFRYFFGWENFWFAFDHPLNGATWSEVWAAGFAAAPVSPDQAPDQSNSAYIWESIVENPEWQHGEVWEAMGLTVLMALLGIMLATIVGLPLAFVAARNVNPIAPLRLAVKKLLDFLRAVDMLIWSLIFIRAFGQGPLSGTLAIAFTDTGTLGKLYSEAIENADRKQAEGVSSVGAGAIQRNWFGIFPQILPIFVSEALYFLESNTRSATIIGILGAGGIGLKLAETIRTGQDWENTAYIILLVIIVVIVMDNLSAMARRRIIAGRQPDLDAILTRRDLTGRRVPA